MIVYRELRESDIGLISTTWVNSYRPFLRWLSNQEYRKRYTEAVVRSLSQEGTTTHVAALERNSDVIAGWAHGFKHVLHYVYVLPQYRGAKTINVAKNLISKFTDCGYLAYTHYTFDWNDRLANRPFVYRPDRFQPLRRKKNDQD